MMTDDQLEFYQPITRRICTQGKIADCKSFLESRGKKNECEGPGHLQEREGTTFIHPMAQSTKI